MAEEYQLGALCGGSLWSSIRCADLFSCSMAVAGAGDLSGSFGWIPAPAAGAVTFSMPASGDNSPGSSETFQDFYEPQFSGQIAVLPPGMDSSIFPSVDWCQSFLFGEQSEDSLEDILSESAMNNTQFRSSFLFPPVFHQSILQPADDSIRSDLHRRGISGEPPLSLLAKPPSIPKASPPLTQQPNFENGLSFKEKPTHKQHIPTTKSNTEASTCSNFPAAKKLRIETPSPLPSFKVRKEKLGDRITALQQLVSPFGKTDTASVLHEAIQYIKFLHEQVSVLSNPYMRMGSQMNQQQEIRNTERLKERECRKTDLRSTGLCLAPISSTLPLSFNGGC